MAVSQEMLRDLTLKVSASLELEKDVSDDAIRQRASKMLEDMLGGEYITVTERVAAVSAVLNNIRHLGILQPILDERGKAAVAPASEFLSGQKFLTKLLFASILAREGSCFIFPAKQAKTVYWNLELLPVTEHLYHQEFKNTMEEIMFQRQSGGDIKSILYNMLCINEDGVYVLPAIQSYGNYREMDAALVQELCRQMYNMGMEQIFAP